MYEKSTAKLAPVRVFRRRLLNALSVSVVIIFISLMIGIIGYRFLAGFGCVDSFLNAAMILGGMGPVDVLETKGAKIFAGCYALFSGVSFLIGIGVILTPMLHRFLGKTYKRVIFQ
jgi:hypothetical protein